MSYPEKLRASINLEIELLKADITRILNSGQVNLKYIALLENNLQDCYTKLENLDKGE